MSYRQNIIDSLEISEVKLSELDPIKFRLDAEFYQRKYLILDKAIRKLGYNTIQSLGGVIDCSAFYPSIVESYNFNGVGVPFLRVNEIQNGLVAIRERTAFLPESIIKSNGKTIALANDGDIIIAKGGNTLAKIGLLNNGYPYYALSRDVMVLKTSRLNSDKIDNYFLWIFLHSKYGRQLLLRTASQTGQPHLTVPSILELPIPSFKFDFTRLFSDIFNKASAAEIEAEIIFNRAIQIIEKELGFENWPSTSVNTAVKSYSNSYQKFGRIDSQYYLLHYEQIENQLKMYPLGCNSISESINLYDDNFKPEDDKMYNYIELSDIGKSGEIKFCSNEIGQELPSRARRKVKTGNVLISTLEGSINKCGLVPSEYDNSLCSTGFYVIDSNNINSETLIVLFKSFPLQEIMKKICSGSIMASMNKDEFLRILIPNIRKEVQDEILPIMKKCIELRRSYNSLLSTAKQAVELAIEQDVQKAINFITNNT